MKNPMRTHSLIRGSAVLVICILALAALGSTSSAWAAISVTNLNDDGPGSLRQAIADAESGDTITFGVYGTITLTSGALTIGKNLDIEGPGPQYLKVSGDHASRAFVILAGSAMLSGITISDGLADGNSPFLPSVGGAILNLSGLELSDVVLSGNWAIGDASTAPLDYPGVALGGAVANFGSTDVNDSEFTGNLVWGADGVSSPVLAGSGGGGSIANGGILTVTYSRFARNQAIGGNNNSGIFFPGHGIGGAIVSVSSASMSADMVVENCEFSHNQAIAGDGNISPAPADFGANKATGGAINIAGGTATIDGCKFEHNWSIGGAGKSGSDGGVGAGGAVMVNNFSGYGTEATVSNSKIEHNIALGGPGSAGRDGGAGQGGGFISAAAGILTVIDTTVAHNHARGGPGGEGGNGGNGLGGGLYDQYDSAGPLPPPGNTELMIKGAIVTKNLALGGGAGDGGSEGQGIGGGVYYLGTYSVDSATIIEKNQATTSNDNVGP